MRSRLLKVAAGVALAVAMVPAPAVLAAPISLTRGAVG